VLNVLLGFKEFLNGLSGLNGFFFYTVKSSICTLSENRYKSCHCTFPKGTLLYLKGAYWYLKGTY